MLRISRLGVTSILVAALTCLARAQAPRRLTIPEMVARGGVAAAASVPSGPPLTVDQVLRNTDAMVIGWVGEPQAYLSQDQLDILTDYLLRDPVYVYPPSIANSAAPPPPVMVTQLGGTMNVNGVDFTVTYPALAPLSPGTRCLFLLKKSDDKFQVNGTYYDKYRIAGQFYGAFDLTNNTLTPLTAKQGFAPEYRDLNLSEATGQLASAIAALQPGR